MQKKNPKIFSAKGLPKGGGGVRHLGKIPKKYRFFLEDPPKSYGNFSPGYPQNIRKNQKKESAKNGTKIGEKMMEKWQKKVGGNVKKSAKQSVEKKGKNVGKNGEKILHLYYHQKW